MSSHGTSDKPPTHNDTKLLIICRILASFGVGITVPVVMDIMPVTSASLRLELQVLRIAAEAKPGNHTLDDKCVHYDLSPFDVLLCFSFGA